MTRLADFIESNMERILAEWEQYAREYVPAGKTLDSQEIRNGAEEMLRCFAIDMRRAQSKEQQAAKSKGRAPRTEMTDTAAQKHAADRLNSGFSLQEMISEYRALRASVVRLWIESEAEHEDLVRDDLIRFNEAIDEALVESTARYTESIERTKNLFLAVLAHDIRNPLGAITMSAHRLRSNGSGKVRELAERVASSSTHLRRIVDDLLEFTRVHLGSGIPISPTGADVGELAHEVVGEMSAVHPDHRIILSIEGRLDGHWDKERLRQVLSNLVSNAVQHGDCQRPIEVQARARGEQVQLSVHNWGSAIPPHEFSRVFHPLAKLHHHEAKPGASHHLGLGLYIAHEIVNAHHGTIDIESSDEGGTTFTVILPRYPSNESNGEPRDKHRTRCRSEVTAHEPMTSSHQGR